MAAIVLLTALCPLPAVTAYDAETVSGDEDYGIYREGESYYAAYFNNFAGLKKLLEDENFSLVEDEDNVNYMDWEAPLVIEEDLTLPISLFITELEVPAGVADLLTGACGDMLTPQNGSMRRTV